MVNGFIERKKILCIPSNELNDVCTRDNELNDVCTRDRLQNHELYV
jgi:hypothetical protein